MNPPNNKQETEAQTFIRLNEARHEQYPKYTNDYLLLLCHTYHKQREKIEQQGPAKTLQEIKDEVARSYNYSSTKAYADWNSMVSYLKTERWIIDGRFDEAAELYAQQFRRREVTDEEIESQLSKMILYPGKSKGVVQWFIEKLNAKH